MKILIVDDFSTMRRIIKNLLRDLGFTNTVEADDGTTAIPVLNSGSIDFLVTDWNMPGMTGIDLLRHVRAADSAADDVRNRATGVVRVGAPLVLASTALPMAMRDYQQIKPKVVVRVRDVPVDQLVDRVADGDVDLAIGPLVWTTRAGPLALRFFRCPWAPWQRPRPLGSVQFRWVRREDLPALPFPPADAGLVSALAEGRLP